ncbi:hypothetical protein VN97_g4265 [Penicillium thymicola]|uniref:Uncharacterized protein n=1 Tax=Penicillium thymicola TaxID=293382 RepID=A0AAI9TKL4_PENTH|nr:hypothetical protein VN97_g4265 [Penicillium thymicola]
MVYSYRRRKKRKRKRKKKKKKKKKKTKKKNPCAFNLGRAGYLYPESDKQALSLQPEMGSSQHKGRVGCQNGVECLESIAIKYKTKF